MEIKVPSPGESITEVQISRWVKKDGDFVEKDEEICEIDSDKATLSLNAEAAGTLRISVKEGETVQVGAVIGSIEEGKGSPAPKKKEEKMVSSAVPEKKTASVKEPEVKQDSKSYPAGIPSPAAAKVMREQGISSAQVEGTGKGGRITKEDATNAETSKTKTESQNIPGGFPAATNGSRNERREKMSMLRKRLAERLVAVKQETAMLTTFNEVDMSAIIAIRKKFKDLFKEKFNVGLGFMSFFTKAVCAALKEFPAVNARIDGNEIVFHDYCDIGIAVSAPKGLMVPVIRNAESKSFAQIESEIMELAGKAREGKISIEEMTGGTFTITNGGVFGSMLSTPIINPPQSAILGMHNIVERPVAVQGKVEIRPVMYVALSYDHRIIDGKESVSFLVKVKQMLEEPVNILSGGNDPQRILLGL